MVFDPTKKVAEEKKKQANRVFDPTVKTATETPAAPATPQQVQTPQEQLLATMTDQPGVERVKEAASNIPKSAYNLGKDIYAAVTSPVETAKGLGRVAAGAAQGVIPGEQEQEKYFLAFAKSFGDRYWPMEQFQKTLTEDPVGTAADLATFLFGGGTALRGVGAASKTPVIAEAGKALSTAAAAADPVNIAARGAAGVARAVTPAGLPSKMYESAAKFSTTIPEKDRSRMAKLAVDEGIMPTQGGIDKTRGLISGLNDEITKVIDNATQTGQKIDIDSLFTYLDDVRKDAILTGTPVDNLRSIDRIENQIRSLNARLGKTDLTPQEVQKLKQNIYKDVNYATTKEKVRYKEEAQKAIARAAKEEIEKLHPEIKTMNAREGELISLLQSLERSASRIGNRDIFGIGMPIKAGAGGAVGGVPGALAGAVSALLDTPLVKARLAIALNKATKGKPKIKGGEARAVTYQGGRAQDDGVFNATP